ncbi:SGNH/GDSL hydrolase family protein [Ruminococcaceae bacterium OttesenSCG-928-A16]|nr:SGNH/GDSL hydrolase family protein [Ruminococcaceae bacterium OttesenSCG-928-A16]
MPNPNDKQPPKQHVYKAAPSSNDRAGNPTKEAGAQPDTPQEAPKAPSPAKAPLSAKKPSGKNKPSFIQNILNSKKQTFIAAIVIGILVVALLVVALVAAFAEKDDAPSLPVRSTDQMLTESGYDQTANSLPVSQLGSTILGLTEDAGAEYVEETLFLGDSNTARMLSYRDITNVTLANSIGVEGMGIQAVPTLACAKFKGSSMVTMPAAVKIMQPRRVVITFGTNNAGGMSEESFIAAYKTALDAIYEAYPYTDIIIGAVPPIARVHMNEGLSMTAIDKYNLALAKLAEQEGYKFLNWTEALKDPATGFCKEGYVLSSDGIHISRTGMEAMFTYLRTHSYITEDTRPKPLAAIPAREGTLPSVVSKDPTATSKSDSSSASSNGVANVVFSASEGGTIQINGQTFTSTSFEVALGGTCPNATAVANEGYQFAYWACSVGQLNPNNPTLSGFKVFSTVKAGDTVTVTAVFTKIPVSSVVPPPATSLPVTSPPASVPVESTPPPASEAPPASVAPPPPASVAPPPPASVAPEAPASVTPEPPADIVPEAPANDEVVVA